MQKMKRMVKAMMVLFLIGGCWLTNTVSGQVLIDDLRQGLDGSDAVFDNAFEHNGFLYFIANENGLGTGLFKTDVSSGVITKIEGTPQSSVTLLMGFLGDDLLYWAGDPFSQSGLALYKTNGSVNGGTLVIDINQENDFFVTYPMNIELNNVMYFIGNDGVTGFELWRTDGTASGTYLVKDINPGIESSIVNTTVDDYFGKLGGRIYFGAAEPVNGAELWTSDGTELGTFMVANIDTAAPIVPQFGSNPAYFRTYNNELYFSGYRPVDGRELWKTDGTAAGTELVKDLAAGDSYPQHLIEYNGLLYFTAYVNGDDYTLIRSDGTTAGTGPVKTAANGGPGGMGDQDLRIFNGKLYFPGTAGNGYTQIWSSDGTANGTTVVTNAPDLFNYPIYQTLATTNYFYFMSSDDATNMNAIYRIDTLNATVQLTTNFSAYDQSPLYLLNSCLIVIGDNGATGNEPYSLCGQSTQPVGLTESTAITFNVYPNPATSVIHLKTTSSQVAIADVQLVDFKGSVYSVTIEEMNDQEIRCTFKEGIAPGIYTLMITTNSGEVMYQRIVVA